MAEELGIYTPNGPAPLVTPDGSAKLTSRRPGRVPTDERKERSMTGLERRLQKLEEDVGSGEPCPECGHIAGKPTSDTLNFEVFWDYTGEEEPEDEFCGTCGTQLVFNVAWGAEGKQCFHSYEPQLRLVEEDDAS